MTRISLFISHASSDVEIARTLVALAEKALKLPARAIRCTSVDGYRLPAGIDTDDALRAEVFDADSFIALLSPASLQSTYVLFELGARWGARKQLIPLFAGGTTAADIKSPLTGLNALSASVREQVFQLVEDLAHALGHDVEPVGTWASAVDQLVAAASRVAPVAAKPHVVSARSGLSEDEIVAIIQNWIGTRPSEENRNVIYYEDVDRALNLPQGSAKRFIETAAAKYNYVTDRKGDNLILFKQVPARSRVRGF